MVSNSHFKASHDLFTTCRQLVSPCKIVCADGTGRKCCVNTPGDTDSFRIKIMLESPVLLSQDPDPALEKCRIRVLGRGKSEENKMQIYNKYTKLWYLPF